MAVFFWLKFQKVLERAKIFEGTQSWSQGDNFIDKAFTVMNLGGKPNFYEPFFFSGLSQTSSSFEDRLDNQMLRVWELARTDIVVAAIPLAQQEKDAYQFYRLMAEIISLSWCWNSQQMRKLH